MAGHASVVVLNWNGRALLRECLTAALAQTYEDYRVLVVDNGSTDGSSEYIQSTYPDVTLLTLGENLHFARGTNQGMRAALADRACEYVVTLNNDTRVDPEWLAELVRAAQGASVGMVASKLRFMDRPHILNSTGLLVGRDGSSRDRGWNEPDEGQYDDDTDIFGPSAGAALYRRECLARVGLFDEDFIAYYEDVDLAWRVRLAGWESRFAPRSVVFHKYSASGGARSTSRQHLFARNRVWNLVQNYPWRHVALSPLWNAIGLANPLLRRHRRAIASDEGPSMSEKARAQARGRLDAYAGLNRALAKRRIRQASSRVDSAIVGHWLRDYGVPIEALATA